MGYTRGILRLVPLALLLVSMRPCISTELEVNSGLQTATLSATPNCSPTQTGSLVLLPSTSQFSGLPLPIPEGRNGGDQSDFNFLTGTGTEFLNTPAASSASIYVCIDDVLPQNLK